MLPHNVYRRTGSVESWHYDNNNNKNNESLLAWAYRCMTRFAESFKCTTCTMIFNKTLQATSNVSDCPKNLAGIRSSAIRVFCIDAYQDRPEQETSQMYAETYLKQEWRVLGVRAQQRNLGQECANGNTEPFLRLPALFQQSWKKRIHLHVLQPVLCFN